MFSSLWHQYQEGGWAMWLILFWLICSIAVIVERTVYLFGASINKDVFVATMQKCILAGDVAKAVKMCSAANAPLARIVQAGLVKVNRPDEEVQAGMDEAALREMPLINRRTGFLALFSNLAMLCGLFGTIVGLIRAFGAVGNEAHRRDGQHREHDGGDQDAHLAGAQVAAQLAPGEREDGGHQAVAESSTRRPAARAAPGSTRWSARTG